MIDSKANTAYYGNNGQPSSIPSPQQRDSAPRPAAARFDAGFCHSPAGARGKMHDAPPVLVPPLPAPLPGPQPAAAPGPMRR